MFTGIIQELGIVSAVEATGGGNRIEIRAKRTASETNINDSICVNGVCQTVVSLHADSFIVEAVEETLSKTTLGSFKTPQKVNLELPLRLSDRLGGHLVQGHVDGMGKVAGIEKLSSSWLVTIELPQEFMRYVIPVGSIAIDGVSLTVARLEQNLIAVSLIPHTLEVTTLSALEIGHHVNIELDLIGKYLERLIVPEDDEKKGSGLTGEMLKKWGYEN